MINRRGTTTSSKFGISRKFIIAVASGLILFCWWRNGPSSKLRRQYSDYLHKCLEGPIRYDYPLLVQYVKEKVLDPPSHRKYNLNKRNLLEQKHPSQVFYVNYSKFLFNSQNGGFFVEAGALDGQSMSNTLTLENSQRWKGLLIEPDPANYIGLRRKNRKAWTAKACLSVNKYPNTELLSSMDVTLHKRYSADGKYRSMGSFVQVGDGNSFQNRGLIKDVTSSSHYTAQCFPLETFLLALNVTKVDLLSLDVEAVEEDIIRDFDYDRFDIQVIFLEWSNMGKLEWLRLFMDRKGYTFVANRIKDIIFVKKGSKPEKTVLENLRHRNFTYYEEEKTSWSL